MPRPRPRSALFVDVANLPLPVQPKRKALLVGICYNPRKNDDIDGEGGEDGQNLVLKGPHRDVLGMKDLLLGKLFQGLGANLTLITF